MHQVEDIPLSDIQEFVGNASLFSDSLSEKSIEGFAELVKDTWDEIPACLVSRRKDGIWMVDGHRRKLVAALRGEETLRCIDVGVLTDREIENRILDCFEGVRDASLREKVAVYIAQRNRLMRERGGSHGGLRTSSSDTSEDSDASEQEDKSEANEASEAERLKADEINALAARKAGIGSATVAKQLVKIFRTYHADIQNWVNTGLLAPSSAKDVQARVDLDKITPREASRRIAEERAKAAKAKLIEERARAEEEEAAKQAKLEEAPIVQGNVAENPFEVDHPSPTPSPTPIDSNALKKPPEKTEPRKAPEGGWGASDTNHVAKAKADEVLASGLLKGKEVDRCVELLILAIEGATPPTMSIMRGVCLGLGMAWDDEEPVAEEVEQEDGSVLLVPEEDEVDDDDDDVVDEVEEPTVAISNRRRDAFTGGDSTSISEGKQAKDDDDDVVDDDGPLEVDDEEPEQEDGSVLLVPDEPKAEEPVVAKNWNSLPKDALTDEGKPLWRKDRYGKNYINQMTGRQFGPEHFGEEVDDLDDLMAQFS